MVHDRLQSSCCCFPFYFTWSAFLRGQQNRMKIKKVTDVCIVENWSAAIFKLCDVT